MRGKAVNQLENLKYLIGNWKANKTVEEARSWILEVRKQNPRVHPRLALVLVPSFIHLTLFKEEFPELTLGCQDLSPYGDGAYTGEVTARMLADLVEFAILGHSERRHWFHETSIAVAQKMVQAIDHGITPIVAVHADIWKEQLRAMDQNLIRHTILMYEPPEAISRQIGPIGRGDAAPLDEVKEMIASLKRESGAKAVIYGGSVKGHNIAAFMSEPSIDGVLPGSASLNPNEWVKMIHASSEAIESVT